MHSLAGALPPRLPAILDQELSGPNPSHRAAPLRVASSACRSRKALLPGWEKTPGLDPDDPEFVQKLADFEQYRATEDAQAIQPGGGRRGKAHSRSRGTDPSSTTSRTVLRPTSKKLPSGLSSRLPRHLCPAPERHGSFNMDAEDLTSLMESYANASQLTYDNNLQTLATPDDPAAIQIYPKDFEAKERVLDAIDVYNDEQRARATMTRSSATPTTWASSWAA